MDAKDELDKINELVGIKSTQSISRSTLQGTKLSARDIAKKLRPDLHNKTHFQAVLAMVHKASKTLQGSPDVTPVGAAIEFEDMEEAMETYDEQAAKAKAKELESKTRDDVRAALPPLPAASFRNMSPLRDRKGREKTMDCAADLFRVQQKQQQGVMGKYRSIMKEESRLPKINKKISFKLPFPGESMSSSQTQPVERLNETEKLGKRILKVCNVFPFNVRKDKSPQLHKGQGHTIAGSGKSNQDVYTKVFGNQ